MLESLHVKNLALIKESEVLFDKGLNILSGETGAGKSIILGSIRLALGAKATSDFIRNGEEYALIELIFKTDKEEILNKLKELDIPIEEDNSIFIQRKILEGRSLTKINGETITSKGLKQVASMLINIHGQNDTAELLDSKNYLDILDDFAGAEAIALKEKVEEEYRVYITTRNELDKAQSTSKNRDKELSLAEFEVNEINAARLQIGEDEELEQKYKKMSNAKRIIDGLSRAYSAISDEQGASSSLDYSLREVRTVLGYDNELSAIEESIATAADIIADCKRSMADYIDSMQFSDGEFYEIENRLDTINHLKNKYGDSIEKVLEYADKQNEMMERLADFESYLAELERKVNVSKDKLLKTARVLSELRSEKAQILSDELVRNLKELNLDTVRCSVCVNSDEEKVCASGIDEVEFMVTFNVGEPLKPLSMVASGGELSRFMLALKAITADKEEIDTLIFDEIDAGISGKTAWNVAEKMNVIGSSHQVIAITHLPQIAAMADTHYLIEKASGLDSTVTDIYKLSEEKSVEEVARLMSTDTITDSIRESAKELKNQSKKIKQK